MPARTPTFLGGPPHPQVGLLAASAAVVTRIALVTIGQNRIGSVAPWSTLLRQHFNALGQVYGMVAQAFIEPADERELSAY